MSPGDLIHHGPSGGKPPSIRERQRALLQPLQLFFLLALAGLCYLFANLAAAHVLDVPAGAPELAAGVGLFVPLTAAATWVLVIAPLSRGHAIAWSEAATRSRSIEDRLRARENDARLQHALEIAEDEDSILRIAEQALQVMPEGSASQLILADDPDAEVSRVITVGEMPGAARCTIRRPRDCPTVRWGVGMVYEDSMALSACPGLGGQIDPSCAAACTPIIAAGRGTGMMRSLGTTGDPDLFRALQSLSTNANRIGKRLAVIRSMAASEMKAATDALTGLANRRTLDLRLAALIEDRAPFSLVLIDIDHFKQVNDAHGHETGDRALKTLATTMQQCIRRDALVCRFGGEEFVLLLPTATIERAAGIIEQVRTELPRATARAGVPCFTISAGVIDNGRASDAEGLLRAADELLYRAKSEGRDRVILPTAA